jgi:hypothetical protein
MVQSRPAIATMSLEERIERVTGAGDDREKKAWNEARV